MNWFYLLKINRRHFVCFSFHSFSSIKSRQRLCDSSPAVIVTENFCEVLVTLVPENTTAQQLCHNNVTSRSPLPSYRSKTL